MPFDTEQEEFWAGEFGDDYIERNRSAALLASNCHWFGWALSHTRNVESVLELGANIGMNLRALRTLLGDARLDAVEINESAAAELRALDYGDVQVGSLLDLDLRHTHDLVFTKTVLIHVAPDRLPDAYDVIARAARRYVLLAEYYNPSPVEVTYRGHEHRLFKRDYAGEFLDRHPDFQLVDYAFSYRSDPVFPQDDITWFLLERR